MIRINLLPVREAQRAIGRRQQLSVALLGLTVALLIMVVPYVVQGRKLSRLDGQIARLQTEIQKFNQQDKEVRLLDKEKADLHAKLKVITELKQKRTGPTRTLEDLSGATPQKLWLVSFADSNGHATLTGMALDNQTIAEFMRQLQGSKYFYDVDLVETSQSLPIRSTAAGDTGMVFKKFSIKANLDYLGRGGKPAPSAPAAAHAGA
jgi:type IV pilus assembly protein PilN